MPASTLAAPLCAVLTKSAMPLSPALIRSAITGVIYNFTDGTKTALTPTTLGQLIGTNPLVYVNVNDNYLASIPNHAA
jgi:hypothetical protein